MWDQLKVMLFFMLILYVNYQKLYFLKFFQIYIKIYKCNIVFYMFINVSGMDPGEGWKGCPPSQNNFFLPTLKIPNMKY